MKSSYRFIGDFDLSKIFIRSEDRELLHQLSHVLRLHEGDHIFIGDGKWTEALCEITSLEKDWAEFKVIETSENERELSHTIILYCSILKRDNFELVVQKATEVGIKEIAPILLKRTVKLGLDKERLSDIVREAAEQSGRGFLPVLHEPMDFEGAIEHAKENEINLFFDVNGEGFEVDRLRVSSGGRLGIFIGPEGGWDQEEIKRAHESKFKLVSLGALTLRAETAAIVASYLAALVGQETGDRR